LSLDEAYLDVTENLKGIISATRIAEEICALIRAETELTASAGVSYEALSSITTTLALNRLCCSRTARFQRRVFEPLAQQVEEKEILAPDPPALRSGGCAF
jgi:nucleotidyltransferase/DNA polymerase involved in DNA repair